MNDHIGSTIESVFDDAGERDEFEANVEKKERVTLGIDPGSKSTPAVVTTYAGTVCHWNQRSPKDMLDSIRKMLAKLGDEPEVPKRILVRPEYIPIIEALVRKEEAIRYSPMPGYPGIPIVASEAIASAYAIEYARPGSPLGWVDNLLAPILVEPVGKLRERMRSFVAQCPTCGQGRRYRRQHAAMRARERLKAHACPRGCR